MSACMLVIHSHFPQGYNFGLPHTNHGKNKKIKNQGFSSNKPTIRFLPFDRSQYFWAFTILAQSFKAKRAKPYWKKFPPNVEFNRNFDKHEKEKGFKKSDVV